MNPIRVPFYGSPARVREVTPVLARVARVPAPVVRPAAAPATAPEPDDTVRARLDQIRRALAATAIQRAWQRRQMARRNFAAENIQRVWRGRKARMGVAKMQRPGSDRFVDASDFPDSDVDAAEDDDDDDFRDASDFADSQVGFDVQAELARWRREHPVPPDDSTQVWKDVQEAVRLASEAGGLGPDAADVDIRRVVPQAETFYQKYIRPYLPRRRTAAVVVVTVSLMALVAAFYASGGADAVVEFLEAWFNPDKVTPGIVGLKGVRTAMSWCKNRAGRIVPCANIATPSWAKVLYDTYLRRPEGLRRFFDAFMGRS